MTTEVKCGHCGKKVELVEKPGDRTKLVAICDCRGTPVQVYETDSGSKAPALKE